jgi:ABC-type uncharacterized transport system auxiliary subunit
MKLTITSCTAIVAALAALFLVAGCHSAPQANGFSASSADKAAEARLRPAQTMPHLQAYDEQFYVPPPEDAASN